MKPMSTILLRCKISISVLGAILLVASPISTSRAAAASSDSPFPVHVSANGRYLEDASGQPFLFHGDTAWYLISELTREETEEYLENRRQKGFNTILVSLGETDLTDKPTKNKYGDPMFTTPDDFSTPNEKFFAHVDWVLQKAREKGILVVLNPCYTGPAVSRKDALAKYVNANGPTKCRNYGRYIGNRYKNDSNIIWQAVGDLTPTMGSEMEKNWLEILLGIKEHAPEQLWSAHYRRFSTALDQSAFAPHMSLDNAYGGNRSYVHTLRAYNRTPPKPTFFNEGYYEDTRLGASPDVGKPPMLRAQAYGVILSGATGHIFGSEHVYSFGNPLNPNRPDWRTGMDRQGSREMVHVKALFDGRAWYELVPDQNHTVVTNGYGMFGADDRTPGGDYVTSARTGDGSLVIAYVPSTGTGTRTITVDMTKLARSATAQWFNPTSGAYTTITGSPFANVGARGFTTPGDNGTGTNDWVLVLESENPAASTANFSSGTQTVARFGVHEIVLTGDGSASNPFDTIATVKFVPPSGEKNAKRVHAFYDGGNTWRARVNASETGDWSWSSACDSDAGLNAESGTFRCEESKLRGRLLPHPKNSRQWMTEDRRWFLNVVDTAYFLLSSRDELGGPIPEEDFQAYVRDAVDHGITAFMAYGVPGPKSWDEEGSWTENYFVDASFSTFRLKNFRVSDQRLRWMLNHYPDVAVEFIMFPRGARYATDQTFWKNLAPQQRERILRYMVARFAAYPQIYWQVSNDAHYGPKYPNNNAFVREVGGYLQQHDLWQHPRSTGHARWVDFYFGEEDWATFVHLENNHELGAVEYAKYAHLAKPVLLGEDRYEYYNPEKDPVDMRYYQRRLFWAWLFSGGSANYGGCWWVLYPYSQIAQRTLPVNPYLRSSAGEAALNAVQSKLNGNAAKTVLTGLDSVRNIRDYFEARRIELSDFNPDHALVNDPDVTEAVRAPKVMRRGQEEFLIYHPNAAADGREARVDNSRPPRFRLDLRNVEGKYAIEWYRADDGQSQSGGEVTGGDWRELTAPWTATDVVVRLLRL